jgi:hypothetical protein
MEGWSAAMASGSKYCTERQDVIMDVNYSVEHGRIEELHGVFHRGPWQSCELVGVSTASSLTESSDIIAKCITVVGPEMMSDSRNGRLVGEVDAPPAASPWLSFRGALRKARGLSDGETPSDLAVTAASNDISGVGRLLGPRDVNTVYFNLTTLPESLVRRQSESSLLDVAVGSGSIEMTKCLLEFHGGKVRRETLKMAISTGNLQLIKMAHERLPALELRDRLDLLEVAAELHRDEVLAWLLRDATVFERELLGVFALEWKLADALVAALENGLRPWLSRTRDVALKWRASSQLEFVMAPDGFWSDGGWWTAVSGVVSALRTIRSEILCRWTRPKSLGREGSNQTVVAFSDEWTAELSQTQLGEKAAVKRIIFPAGVTAIGKEALQGFEALESVVFPATCTGFGRFAVSGCNNLKAISLPVGCRATGYGAFAGCSALSSVTIPVGCTAISDYSFRACISLRGVWFPDGCTRIGQGAFLGSSLEHAVIPDACEIGSLAFQCCRSLTSVTIGECATIGYATFSGCTTLASVTLSSTHKSIGNEAFGLCPALATIVVPKGCQMYAGAFRGSKTRVTKW